MSEERVDALFQASEMVTGLIANAPTLLEIQRLEARAKTLNHLAVSMSCALYWRSRKAQCAGGCDGTGE